MAELVCFGVNGDQYPMSLECSVTNLRWSTGIANGSAGGCQEASWELDLDPNDTPPMLGLGRRFEIWSGDSRVFAGFQDQPQPGIPWTGSGKGLAVAGKRFLCLDATPDPTSVPNTAIDQAIVRGLPWTRPTSVSDVAFSSADLTTGLNYLDALLDAYCASVGMRWAVWADGQLLVAVDPTTPRWLLLPGSGIMGVTDDDFGTDVFGRFVSAVSGTPPVPSDYGLVSSTDSAAVTDFGRREVPADYTDLGLITSTRAQSLTDARRTLVAATTNYTNGVEVTADDLVTPGMVPADLAQVRAWDVVRICEVLDAQGQLAIGETRDVVIGHTDYTAGASSMVLEPIGKAARSLEDLLALTDAEKSFVG